MGEAQSDIQHIRETLARVLSAIRLNGDPADAFRDATDLSKVGDQIRADAARIRADIALELYDPDRISLTELGQALGLSKPGMNRLVQEGRRREKAALQHAH